MHFRIWIQVDDGRGGGLAKEYAEMLSMYSGHENMTFGGRAYVARFASLQGRTEEAEAWFQKLVSRYSRSVWARWGVSQSSPVLCGSSSQEE